MDPHDPRLLEATDVIESTHPRVQALTRHLIADAADPADRVARLFTHVRDEIRYFPFSRFDLREAYRATATLDRGVGYCVQKAVVLVTLARAAGFPAALHGVNIRNQRAAPHIVELMGSDQFAFHAYAKVWLDGRWVGLTPAFDRLTSERHGFPLVTFDGHADALFAPTDDQGRPFVTYVKHHGDFTDLDLDRLLEAWQQVYGADRVQLWRAMADESTDESLRTQVSQGEALPDAWAGIRAESPS